jgi:hypothetical protein
MRKGIRIGVSTLASLVLIPVFWARPVTHSVAVQSEQAAPQTQSVSGKIASVDKNSFTLTVNASGGQQLEQTAPATMTFTTDKNTTIEGKLQVGSNADVTYRSDNGTNIAVSVHVTQ